MLKLRGIEALYVPGMNVRLFVTDHINLGELVI